MAVAPWIVSDELWELVEPLLPVKERRFRYPGRKRLPDRQALQGILFVLHTGISWPHLPLELGFGSGVTCWRRMDEWQKAGVWERLHALLLARLRAAGEIEWSRAVADAQPCAGEKGGSATGPSPVDRARNGSKHHLLVDGDGDPARLGAHRRQPPRQHPADPARRPGATGARQGRPAAPAARPRLRRPRLRLRSRRRELRQRGINPEIARRKTEHGSGLGRYRWVVERTFAWLHQFKRLLVRYDRRADIHEAFLALGCCLVCYRRLRNTSL